MNKGDFVEVDGLLAVVVGAAGDENVPDEHLALWFGDPQGKRLSQGGAGNLIPEVWTVPIDVCRVAQPPSFLH
jgi:hypothetical protein